MRSRADTSLYTARVSVRYNNPYNAVFCQHTDTRQSCQTQTIRHKKFRSGTDIRQSYQTQTFQARPQDIPSRHRHKIVQSDTETQTQNSQVCHGHEIVQSDIVSQTQKLVHAFCLFVQISCSLVHFSSSNVFLIFFPAFCRQSKRTPRSANPAQSSNLQGVVKITV